MPVISERTRARWTPSEDETLVDVIRQHVESGSSLTAAFAAAAELLPGRSPAACGFRWNTELKNHYTLPVQPRRGRRQRQPAPEAGRAAAPAENAGAAAAKGTAKTSQLPAALSQLLDAAPKVQVLFANLSQELNQCRDRMKMIEKENKALRQRIATLEALSDAAAQADLETLYRLLQRARQMNLTAHAPEGAVVYERLDGLNSEMNTNIG
jgi:prespore-specific regulator